MEKKKISIRKVLMVEAIILLLVGLALFWAQTQVTERAQQKNLRDRLDSITQTFTESYRQTQDVTEIYNEARMAEAQSIAYLLDHEEETDLDSLKELYDISGEEDILIGSGYVREEGYSYFTAYRSNGQAVTIRKTDRELDAMLNNIYSSNKVLQAVVGDDDLFFIVTNKDGLIVYYPDETYIGKPIGALGIELNDLDLEGAKWLKIAKDRYFVSSIVNEPLDITISCGIDLRSMTKNSHIAVGILYAVIAVIFTIMVTYSYYAKQEEKRKSSRSADYTKEQVGKKLSVFLLIGLLLVGGVTYYIQTLFNLTLHNLKTTDEKLEVEVALEEAEHSLAELTNTYNEGYLKKARIISHILSTHPELQTKEELAKLTDIFKLQYIMLFDREGKETLSDSGIMGFEISDDPNSQSYAFRVLNYGIPYVVQEARPDDLTGEYHQFIGVTMTNAEGEYDGFLQIAVSPEKLQDIIEEVSFSNVLANAVTGSGDVIFAVDKDSGRFIYAPDSKIIGEAAVDLGMTADQLRNRYYGGITVNGTNYFADCLEKDNTFIFLAARASTLFSGRITMTVFTLLITAANMVFYALYFNRHDVMEIESTLNDPYVEVTTPGGHKKRTLNIVSRVLGDKTAWIDRTAEEKTSAVVQMVIGLFATGFLVAFLFRNVIYTEDTIFGFLLSPKWKRGLNVFSLTIVLIAISIYILAMAIVNRLMNALITVVGPRNETRFRLLKSFIHYVTILFLLYYCLTLFGMDTQSLLASAGLITVFIGLGAKDLITDILAGLFIIFEREFQVGDIIEVGGFTGRVIEIGIRSTRIISFTQDVKSINNRNLTNIINKTRQNSNFIIQISIPLDQDLSDVEEVLKNELPKIAEREPNIISGPEYFGVIEIANGMMKLGIRTECAEMKKMEVRAAVNREIKNLFDDHGFKMK